MNIKLLAIFSIIVIIGMILIASVMDFSEQWKTKKVIESSKNEESAKNLLDSLDDKKPLLYSGFILFLLGLVGIVLTVIFS